MTRHKSTRLLALLIALILCMSQASAVNIVHEEDYEVVPDYSQMDVEAAVTTYLSKEMKLNPAAVCGILANIDYESDFSPTVWGDDGTSFGLCQWHESRCQSLFLFCQENMLFAKLERDKPNSVAVRQYKVFKLAAGVIDWG